MKISKLWTIGHNFGCWVYPILSLVDNLRFQIKNISRRAEIKTLMSSQEVVDSVEIEAECDSADEERRSYYTNNWLLLVFITFHKHV